VCGIVLVGQQAAASAVHRRALTCRLLDAALRSPQDSFSDAAELREALLANLRVNSASRVTGPDSGAKRSVRARRRSVLVHGSGTAFGPRAELSCRSCGDRRRRIGMHRASPSPAGRPELNCGATERPKVGQRYAPAPLSAEIRWASTCVALVEVAFASQQGGSVRVRSGQVDDRNYQQCGGRCRAGGCAAVPHDCGQAGE
jgi:hypothetical protein